MHVLHAVTRRDAVEQDDPRQIEPQKRERDDADGAVEYGIVGVGAEGDVEVETEEEFERLEDEGDDKGGNDGVFKVDASVGEKFEDDCTKCSKYENFSNYLPNKRTNDEVFGEELGGLVDRKREDDGA